MEEIIKELEQIGDELYNKYGTDCYTTRCRLHDARQKLKSLTIHSVVNCLYCSKAPAEICGSCVSDIAQAQQSG